MGKREGRPSGGSSTPSSLYQVEVGDRARREIKDLPRDEIRRIIDAIDDLSRDPRPPGASKLHGVKDGWRIRKGDYRILYTIHDAEKLVRIYRVGNRREVYRKQRG